MQIEGVTLSPEEAFDLIKRNTEEIVDENELMEILQDGNARAYWGTAPTGRIHIGYLIPMSKIADFLNAGVDFKILLANLHAHLDDMKSPFELLEHRTEYYRQVILGMLEGLGVDQNLVKFVVGTDFELDPKYSLDLLKLSAIVTLNRSKRAGAEVVRTANDPKLGAFIYPLMQSLDVPHLDCNIAFGGIDQRGIYMLGREYLPKIGYQKPVCVFNPLLPGLTGDKMSASEESTKIDALDSPKSLQKKYSKSFCPERQVEDNPVLVFARTVIFPYLERIGSKFEVKRPEKFGGDVSFENYETLETAYSSGNLHPADLKKAIGGYLVKILEPVRKRFEANPGLLEKAYPSGK